MPYEVCLTTNDIFSIVFLEKRAHDASKLDVISLPGFVVVPQWET